MSKSAKMSADEKIAAGLKAAKLARAERNLAQAKRLEQTTKLRALRFAKEEADREAESQKKADKVRKKTVRPKAVPKKAKKSETKDKK